MMMMMIVMFVSFKVLLFVCSYYTKSLIQCQAHSESILLSPRMSFGIPDADHGEWDKDCCQHCDCDNVHCVFLSSVVVVLYAPHYNVLSSIVNADH